MKLFRRLAGSHQDREEIGLPSDLRMLYQDMHNAAKQRRYFIGDQDVIKQKLPTLIERCQLSCWPRMG